MDWQHTYSEALRFSHLTRHSISTIQTGYTWRERVKEDTVKELCKSILGGCLALFEIVIMLGSNSPPQRP